MESVHPLLVHFPIALLLTAALLELAALAWPRPALHEISLWNLALGTAGAAAAVLSGLQAEAVAKHSFEIWQVMQLHKRLGILTLIVGLGVVAWRVAHRDHLRRRERLLTVAAMLLMCGALAWGAHLGGRLVYEFGVGGTFGTP